MGVDQDCGCFQTTHNGDSYSPLACLVYTYMWYDKLSGPDWKSGAWVGIIVTKELG